MLLEYDSYVVSLKFYRIKIWDIIGEINDDVIIIQPSYNSKSRSGDVLFSYLMIFVLVQTI